MKNKRLLTRASYISLPVVLTVLLFMASCAQAPAPAPKPAPAPAPAPAPTPAPAQVIELKVAALENLPHIYPSIIKRGFDAVQEKAQGKIKVTYYFGATLLSGTEMYKGVVEGAADAATVIPQWTPGRFPLTDALGLGPAFPLAETAGPIFQDFYDKFLSKEWAETKVLWFFGAGPLDLLSKKAVRSVDDMKGLRIRAIGDTAKLVTAWGGTPVFMSVDTLYEALQKGIVDGTFNAAMALKDNRFAEVTKYTTKLSVTAVPYAIVMNLKKYNSLPADVKKLFDELPQWMSKESGKMQDVANQAGIDYGKSLGQYELITLTPQELSRFMKDVLPVNKAWADGLEAKGLPGKKLLEERDKIYKPLFPEVYK